MKAAKEVMAWMVKRALKVEMARLPCILSCNEFERSKLNGLKEKWKVMSQF